jgi:subtilisin family serine protease
MANGNEIFSSELHERVLSNEFLDLIVQYYTPPEQFLSLYESSAPEIINHKYALIHLPITDSTSIINLSQYDYSSIPKLFTLLDTTSLEASGILRTQNQPILNLDGRGIILGFIDTGIEYTHDAFKNSDGTSKILSIWDQTIQDGPPPANFSFGTEYTKEQIDEALNSDTPLEVVPSTDTNGHGTFMAGVAGGSPNSTEDFLGAAPGASIVMVKLKEAKQYLRDFFMISGPAPAYQETDIIWGVQYLLQVSREREMPLVICIGLGTNQGDHSSFTPLCEVLEDAISTINVNAVVAAGNEAGKAHHYYGKLSGEGEFEDVEIMAGTDASFALELWGQAPELYSIAITSPIGEIVPQIPARLEESQVITFILEKTIIYIDYEVIETRSGSQVILMRFQDPTPGVWRIRVFVNNHINGTYNMWLPITGFIPKDTVFLRPNPDTTITIPATAESVLTSSTYNAFDKSIYIHSSRGYTRTGYISPDIAAPGVNLFGPGLNNTYVQRTGSSGASAITTGAVALIINWGLVNNQNRLYSSREIKNLIIRGASRSPDLLYPNREWGYGTLDVYHIFETLM